MYNLGDKFICKLELESYNKIVVYEITGFINNGDECFIKADWKATRTVTLCELEDEYLPYKGIVRLFYDE